MAFPIKKLDTICIQVLSSALPHRDESQEVTCKDDHKVLKYSTFV